MKFLYDLLPIFLFFVAYKFYNIYVATGVAIAAAFTQIAIALFSRKKPDIMQLTTLGMVIVLGGATLFFRNEMFIKWKPTAVYWILGLVFLGSQWFAQKPLVQKILEKSITLPPRGWTVLNATWYCFFFLMGILNLFVVYLFDTDTWVNFKLFGTSSLTILFVLIQGILVSRYATSQNDKLENGSNQ